MAFEDRTLTCKDCECEFVFSASEQEFYAEKGFQNDPARCPECRAQRKRQRNNRNGNTAQNREMHSVICAECGIETQVPFKPINDRPVYCRDCFQKQKQYSYR
ncbi:MAG: zinc-ribbon domain containing protein [Bacillota bacterium]